VINAIKLRPRGKPHRQTQVQPRLSSVTHTHTHTQAKGTVHTSIRAEKREDEAPGGFDLRRALSIHVRQPCRHRVLLRGLSHQQQRTLPTSLTPTKRQHCAKYSSMFPKNVIFVDPDPRRVGLIGVKHREKSSRTLEDQAACTISGYFIRNQAESIPPYEQPKATIGASKALYCSRSAWHRYA
jgi:hypothetical protein